MKEHIAAITVATDSALSSQEVAALVNRLLALGITKAGELLTKAENATNPESLTYDPEARVDDGLRTITSLGYALEGVNDYKPSYSPNTLYVLGTDADGKMVIRSSRTSEDAVRDSTIMSSALELSQAVELRNVNFAEHMVGGLLVRPATQGARQLLMQKVLASMAGIGDVYTDAREKEGAVRSAENLGILALRLSADTETICVGMLCVDGSHLGAVDIRADGSFLVNVSDDVVEGEWTVQALGKTYPVSRYVGDCGDDETWVLDNVGEFYDDYLATLKL